MTSATRASAPSGDPGIPKVHLVGGGIASMAAAAFGIRDGDIPGHQITIYEELDKIGGALDASGSPENVVPKGSQNLALMDQFCELPDDVVFTVEYSIRPAQAGVYALLGLSREPPAVYKGKHDPRVLYKAFLALHDRRP